MLKPLSHTGPPLLFQGVAHRFVLIVRASVRQSLEQQPQNFKDILIDIRDFKLLVGKSTFIFSKFDMLTCIMFQIKNQKVYDVILSRT